MQTGAGRKLATVAILVARLRQHGSERDVVVAAAGLEGRGVGGWTAGATAGRSVTGELDESAGVADRAWINDYERTKAFADRRARAAGAASDAEKRQ